MSMHKRKLFYKTVTYLATGMVALLGIFIIPFTHATTTGGSGGALTDSNNVPYTGAGSSSQYHIYASHIDTGKPIGIMLHFHGDGAADYTDYNKNSALDADGSTGLVQVARDYNMIFVAVKSPATGSYCSSGSPCWWDNGNPNSDYVAALMGKLYSEYNIDKTRVWFTGYSGGAQLITQYLVLRHSDLVEGGGAVIFAGGGSPVGDSADPTPIYNLADVATSFRQNFRMFWFTGTNDYNDGDGYDSRTDANEGSAWYTSQGFTQTGTNFSYDITHDQVENAAAGYFGMITRQRVSAAYPADTTNPTVSITAPASAATVSGNSVTISATASDNVGVSKVEFRQGATLLGEDTTAPYSYSWDSTSVANGSYNLTARAYDAANNTATSSTVTVTVDNTVIPPADTTNPTVSISAPSNAATVSGGAATISATASDNVGVSKVEFRHGTTFLGEDTTAPYNYAWDTTSVANGSYSLTAQAYDAAGNTATSSAVMVTVDNTSPTAPVRIINLSSITSTNPDVVSKAVVETIGTTCQSITSAASLPSAGLTAPVGVTLAGGIEFSLSCASNGQAANMKITLGQRYDDISKLRAYKSTAGGTLVDISNQVTFTNEASATIVTYVIADGSQLDDDGIANGTIDDPMYIGYVAGVSTTTPVDSGASTLSNTGTNVTSYILTALIAITVPGVVLIWKKQS